MDVSADILAVASLKMARLVVDHEAWSKLQCEDARCEILCTFPGDAAPKRTARLEKSQSCLASEV